MFYYSIIQILITLFLGTPSKELPPASTNNLDSKKAYYRAAPIEDRYNFVNYSSNLVKRCGPSTLQYFFSSLDHMLEGRQDKVNVVHIGDSHIQADYFSGKNRELLQFTFGNGGRGFVFPYKVARTNTPENYSVKFAGNWQYCKNVVSKDSLCNMALSGISVETNDPNAYININPSRRPYINYDFTKAKVFYNNSGHAFNLSLLNDSSERVRYSTTDINPITSQIEFDSPQDHLNMQFQQMDSLQDHFQLFGMSLENDMSGLLYHAIGVNGAEVKSYLRCNLLRPQMEVLKPDLIIISLGTNDTYTRKFDAKEFEDNYEQLLLRIRKSTPNASILLTTPGDGYIYRKYTNYNLEEARNIMYRLADKYNCAVWDFYEIMGGLRSIRTWRNNGLAQRDLLHFTSTGYYLQGELLYNALMDAYESHLTY